MIQHYNDKISQLIERYSRKVVSRRDMLVLISCCVATVMSLMSGTANDVTSRVVCVCVSAVSRFGAC